MPEIEIENKYRISKSQYDSIRGFAEANGIVPTTENHEDRYFSPLEDDFLTEKFPFKWLSVRTRNSKSIINFKHFYPEGAEKHTHAVEYEVSIDSAEEITGVFRELDIDQRVCVRKTRTQFKFKEYKICLDEVEGLGFFLEVELSAPDKDAEGAKKEIHEFASEFGVSSRQQDFRGYPFLLLDDANKDQDLE